jgi:DNA-directed RNA polymerase subunit beta'
MKTAQKMHAKKVPQVMPLLDEVVKDAVVILNRQPTLHRNGVQFFRPVITESKAIGLHSCYCPPFNADFDGDTMAVYLPVGKIANEESKYLVKNRDVLSPASGNPLVVPTQDVILGLYLLTQDGIGENPDGNNVIGFHEASYMCHIDGCDYRTKVCFRHGGKTIQTTLGRVLFNELLPKELLFVNEKITKKRLNDIVVQSFDMSGLAETIEMIDRIKNIGFAAATRVGISVGIGDTVLHGRKKIVDAAHKAVAQIGKQYDAGHLLADERYNRVIDVWSKATTDVEELIKTHTENPLVIMSQSGARGKLSQVRQVMGMKGLVSEPTAGVVIETPITKSFYDGLSVLEYFMSTHGARKGLVDKGMKTAEAGYLTRRLVDAMNGVMIVEKDCGSIVGVEVGLDDALGSVLCDDVVVNDSVVMVAGVVIGVGETKKLKDYTVTRVKVRSVLTCESVGGVCSKCYGWDLSRRALVDVGMHAGVIAAQSIGEPATQMVLQSFHTGGVLAMVSQESTVFAKGNGVVSFNGIQAVSREDDENCSIVTTDGLLKINGDTYHVPVGAQLYLSEGDSVSKGDVLFSFSPYSFEINTPYTGVVQYKDIMEGVTLAEKNDPSGKIHHQISHCAGHYKPCLEIVDGGNILDTIYLPDDVYLVVKDGEEILPGDTLARLPKDTVKTKDITSGLIRIDSLFEMTNIKKPAVISEIDGTVVLENETDSRYIKVKAVNGIEKVYEIGYDQFCIVHTGSFVVAGDKLTEGEVSPHDILHVKGKIYAMQYLANELAESYRFHGINVNRKHFELVVRKMFSKVMIVDRGASLFVDGAVMDREEVDAENAHLLRASKNPISYQLMICGISQIALRQSFLSQISFQNTVYGLANVALMSAKDPLVALKENVLVGNLIPGGISERWAVEEEKGLEA